MEDINIEEKEQRKNGWLFFVIVGDSENKTEHWVDLEEEYWRILTESRHTPRELVKRSFEFLLEKEPKESILSQFDLRVIEDYFPGYEEIMKKRMLL